MDSIRSTFGRCTLLAAIPFLCCFACLPCAPTISYLFGLIWSSFTVPVPWAVAGTGSPSHLLYFPSPACLPFWISLATYTHTLYTCLSPACHLFPSPTQLPTTTTHTCLPTFLHVPTHLPCGTFCHSYLPLPPSIPTTLPLLPTLPACLFHYLLCCCLASFTQDLPSVSPASLFTFPVLPFSCLFFLPSLPAFSPTASHLAFGPVCPTPFYDSQLPSGNSVTFPLPLVHAFMHSLPLPVPAPLPFIHTPTVVLCHPVHSHLCSLCGLGGTLLACSVPYSPYGTT